MFQILFIFQLIACGPSAQETASRAYAAEMQKMWSENHQIERQFMDVAAQIKKGEIGALDVAKRFDERIVPKARALADKVTEVETGNDALESVHAGIVRAWEIRADSYEQMNKAWNETDMQSYTRALNDNRTVREAEDQYLKAVNELLQAHELRIEPVL